MNRNKKAVIIIVLLVSACLILAIEQNDLNQEKDIINEYINNTYDEKNDNLLNSVNINFGDESYVKSATYFSDEWPVNFWNSDMDELDSELAQIKKDGFDSIILVIPWREFQPKINPIEYSEYAFDALREIMQASQCHGLDVYARIGYTWDFYNDSEEEIVDRFCRLLGDEGTSNAWYDYVGKMYYELSEYSNFKGGFITWEDFWNTLGMCDGNIWDRWNKAKEVGYIEWVSENYTLNEYNKKYGTKFKNYRDIVIPKRDEPAMYAMYEFYDNFLNRLLVESQKKFPNLSMEVRLDWDSVTNISGEMEYYKHYNTFLCADSGFTATMYGIPMGFENNGERVSYKEAMEKTEYILSQLKHNNGNKPIYIEQFIFADNTPKFSHNAQIIDGQVSDYLENIAPILLENSEGYGIWTYRNYCANMIYNSQFALDLDGWNIKGEVNVENIKNSNACIMEEGNSISQKIARSRNHFDSDVYKFEVEVKSVDKPGKMVISIGGNKKKINILEAGIYSVELDPGIKLNFDIKIKTDCNIIIDNLKLYSQIQQGYLYDVENNELDCIKSLRILNSQLDN